MRQIVLDTETTGLKWEDGHRIIEIGCIELVNRKFTGRQYHQYINPERPIEEGALAVHGITNAFLETKPLFADVANELMEFLQGAELIIHNAPFDVGFIESELQRLQSTWLPLTEHCRIMDTLVLARQLHTGQRNGLDALCKRYHIDNSERELHGALLDARLLAEVYLAMTGGQGNLFDGLEQATELLGLGPQKTKKSKKVVERQLVVMKASEEEVEQHRKVLEKIAEKTNCLWEMD